MNFKTSSFVLPTVAAGLVMAAVSDLTLAQHNHEGDIRIEDWQGALVTGTETENAIMHDTRMFGGELGEIIPNFADEPGFDSELGEFVEGTSIGFNILDGLRVWNGTDFSAIAAETMTISFATFEVTTADGFVPGFEIPVSSNGEFHKHFGFLLNDPAGEGVYLLAMELYSTDPNLNASQPFYIVWNNESDELTHEEAMEYVEEEMLPVLSLEAEMLTPGMNNLIEVHGAPAGNRVAFAWSSSLGSSPVPGCAGLTVELQNPTLIGIAIAGETGKAELETFIPAAASGRTVHLQAVDLDGCTPSTWMTYTFN